MGGKASKAELQNAVPGRMKANYSGPPFVWVGDSKEQTVPARENDTVVRRTASVSRCSFIITIFHPSIAPAARSQCAR
eukprot:SAG31_NODE_16533_length_705_cov_1.085809_1_plen_77_part_10